MCYELCEEEKNNKKLQTKKEKIRIEEERNRILRVQMTNGKKEIQNLKN